MPTAAAVPSVTDVSQERAESPAVVVESDSAASTQDEVDREIHEISAAYARSREAVDARAGSSVVTRTPVAGHPLRRGTVGPRS